MSEKSSKIYSLYFSEEVIFPPSTKTPSQILKELLMELVALCPVKNVSEELRPSLLALKNHFYKSSEKDLSQLDSLDTIATNFLEKKRSFKKRLLEKIEKL